MGNRRALPDWPASMPLHMAASYCGLSQSYFKRVCPVQPIAFGDTAHSYRWVRFRLDEWLAEKDPNGKPTASRALRLVKEDDIAI